MNGSLLPLEELGVGGVSTMSNHLNSSNSMSFGENLRNKRGRLSALSTRTTSHISQLPAAIFSRPSPVLNTKGMKMRRAAFENLMEIILSQEDLRLEDTVALDWYQRYLESKLQASWSSLVQPSLANIATTGPIIADEDFVVGYKFLTVVAMALTQMERFSIKDLIQTHKCLWKDLDESEDSSQGVVIQLVFSAVGWLTMLYRPAVAPSPGMLEIQKPVAKSRSKVTPLSYTFAHYSKTFQDIDQPFFLFLRKFGTVVPEHGITPPQREEVISAGFVCFAMLSRVVKVKVEWVNSLNSHLEFDHTRKTLRIFRFPSFARMLYRDSNVLSRLYLDNKSVLNHTTPHDLTQQYAREILLSYRLVFGQDKASWKAFRKSVQEYPPRWGCSDEDSEDSDPLLLSLCTTKHTSPVSAAIYDEIDAGEVSPYYYSGSDFRFFGDRLLSLQEYAKSRRPHNWRSLWYDRSNIAFWWTFWAVIFIGGGTLFLGIVALAFQVWSSVSGQRQSNTNNP